MRGAIDDSGVDDLSPTARARLEQCREEADDEVGRAAAEVAEQVLWEMWPFGVLAEAVQCPGDGDVVQVVPGRMGPRSGLPPAGHPGVDESRFAGEAVVRAESQPFGDAGPHPFHERVRTLHQFEHRGDGGRVLEVERDARPATGQQV